MPLPESDLLKTIRDENLKVYRASSQRLAEDIASEHQIAQDYRGRLVYELLQNADDAMSESADGLGAVIFHLTGTGLWVANSGRPLTEPDVRGLCGISASSKTQADSNRRASIGHKGMGFKSVLEITDCPEVYSETHCFRFTKEEALEALEPLFDAGVAKRVSRAPITRFPWGIKTPPSKWCELQAEGIRTAFHFPLKDGLDAGRRQHLAEALVSLPVTSLIFLKHVQSVRILVNLDNQPALLCWNIQRERALQDRWDPCSSFSTGGIYRVRLEAEDGSQETFVVGHDPDVEIGRFRGGLDEVSWDGIEFTEVSVAAKTVDEVPAVLPCDRKRLHVFLPTSESCPYSLLVSGAFASSLSRQEIRVESDEDNYNRFLLGEAARLVRDQLIPYFLDQGVLLKDVLCLLDRGCRPDDPCASAAAQVLYEAVRHSLHDLELIPSRSGRLLSLSSCAVPPLTRDEDLGAALVDLLVPSAVVEGREFPERSLCVTRHARVLVDHGAKELGPGGVTSALSESADPEMCRLQLHHSGKVWTDPVLQVLERYLNGLDYGPQRRELIQCAQSSPVFPVSTEEAGFVRRIVTKGLNCFYPPGSLRGEVPLEGLCFLLQSICWGELGRTERTRTLAREMDAWNTLFQLREFKFPDVMAASVLPCLALDPSEEQKAARQRLRTFRHVAAICQLSGRTPKPSEPLPYERRGSDRALFNLARLDVPCRGAHPGEVKWVPAYRAYFGDDWIGDCSLEWVLAAAPTGSSSDLPAVDFLVPPAALQGVLNEYRYLADTQEEQDESDDEVSVEEDEEEALTTDEKARWMEFFSWLGVNRCLRPIHFHDVEDRAATWLTTMDLRRPSGSAFQRITDETWRSYTDFVRQALRRADRSKYQSTTPYFYKLHDLEFRIMLVAAAQRDVTGQLSQALYDHLARNWSVLERFSRAQVAQVPKELQPSRRTAPPQPYPQELGQPCADYWLYRLQLAPFCPTQAKTYIGRDVWLPSPEVDRRFSRTSQNQKVYFVPTLTTRTELLEGKARAFAVALGIREELAPARFRPKDGRVLTERLREFYEPLCDNQQDMERELRQVIRPVYRHLMEMVSGRASVEEGEDTSVLRNAPILATNGSGGYRFLPAGEVFYLDRRDTRERLGGQHEIWSFVLEAAPVARSAAIRVFQMRLLESDLQWSPRPGDAALSSDDLERYRAGLRELAPYLLARIEANRDADDLVSDDMRRMKRFVDGVEPVSALDLNCFLDGEEMSSGATSRESFVQEQSDGRVLAFVVWGENPWPPDEHDAEALASALSELYGSSYYESFLALIEANGHESRERLLRRAGAPVELESKRLQFVQESPQEQPRATLPDLQASPATPDGGNTTEEEADTVPQNRPLPRKTQLYRPDQLLVDGIPLSLSNEGKGEVSRRTADGQPRDEGDRASKSPAGYGGHTDLPLLDTLGMGITVAYEVNRLKREGNAAAVAFDHRLAECQPDALVFDICTPDRVLRAMQYSQTFRSTMAHLSETCGISPEWPGADVISLDPREPWSIGRLIELKSSGGTTKTQEISWNEWKLASCEKTRDSYYLYLVGNLRSDLANAKPFVRAIRNPFQQLLSEVQESSVAQRKIALQVHFFDEAEHLDLTVVEEGR